MALLRHIACITTTALLLCIATTAWAQAVFINEIHYDNTGGDVNEAIEIAGPAGTDLSCYQLVLYNGGTNNTYSTTTLSGTIDDEGCGYGAVSFSISGIQNGAPDGICLYYDPALCAGPGVASVIQFLSYEGSFTAGNGPANGMTSTDIGVSEPGTTPVGQSLQLTGNGTTYGMFAWQSPATASMGTINTGQNFCSCTLASEPTTDASAIVFSNIGCNGFTIDWTTGNGNSAIVVVRATSAVAGTPTDQTTYTANTVFGSGNTIAAGEFVVYNGTGTTVNVSGLAASTTYHVAIFEYNGAACEENYYTSGSPATNDETTIACATCPYITSALINSCAGSCSEGDNEIVFMNSGGYSIPVNASTINVLYGNSNPATTNYTDAIASNATAIADMHTSAGCGGVFVDAVTAGTIPANSPFWIVHDDICASSALDLTAFCGAGPIYIVFSTDASWIAGGNFANSTSCSGGTRYFRTDFSSLNVGCVIDYHYDCTNNSGTDGDYVVYGSTGGAPILYDDDDCNVETTVLPVQLLHFDAKPEGSAVEVSWSTSYEKDNALFTIERSSDGATFTSLGYVDGQGNSEATNAYTFVDDAPLAGISYYRLMQTDFDGGSTTTRIVAVNFEAGNVPDIEFVYATDAAVQINYNAKDEGLLLEIYDVTGRTIYMQQVVGNSTKIEISGDLISEGVYFAKLSNAFGSDVMRFKK